MHQFTYAIVQHLTGVVLLQSEASEGDEFCRAVSNRPPDRRILRRRRA